ncbi:MAG TPA: DUF1254 domain-containing protein [Solirubrobacteraceae bacterium]|nr:DUF1254 domain-containing protein [Solirubrobacteraceae bacterium]
MTVPRRRLRRLAAGAAFACALLGATAGAASADATSDYDTGLALGAKAYEYGIPLLDTARIFTTATSVNVPDANGHGPVNRFANVFKLADASEKTVNAPNNDTPYSIAWLDLSKEPQILHAPAIKNRFWEFELLDPWTNNFYNITSVPTKLGPGDFGVTRGGDWAVVGPGFKGKLPRGVKKVVSRYNRVWIIGRTYVRGKADLPAVGRIQRQYSITPLSKYGSRYTPPTPARPDTTVTQATIPGTQPGEDPIAFFQALDKEMATFPPPAADQPLLGQLKAVGIGAGLDPLSAGLSADTLRGLRDAVTQGPGKVTAAALAYYFANFDKHNGYLIGDLGAWGTNYALRAIGDKLGVGGQRANIATYPLTLTDHNKAPLSGSTRYVLHIPKSRLPIPTQAFWSLTLYDSSSFFVPNPLNRWVLNDLSHLRKNADGSIDIYVQHDQPTSPKQMSNWLPAPAAGTGFRLIWRLYGLGKALPGVLNGSGWQPPAVMPCDATGHAADGTACAS